MSQPGGGDTGVLIYGEHIAKELHLQMDTHYTLIKRKRQNKAETFVRDCLNAEYVLLFALPPDLTVGM